MRKQRWLEIAAAAFFLMALAESPAYAYLDPGTGSMILQLVLGGVAGGLVILKLYWHQLKEVFSRRGRKREITEGVPPVDK